MKELSINGIFPTPVYFCEMERGFTPQETAFFDRQKFLTKKNVGNISSQDSYILDKPDMAILKSELMAAVQRYADNVMCIKPCVVPFITQSWLNYTEPGQSHHKHAHPNSVISGVMYINADEKTDKIFFFREIYQQVKPVVREWNLFNSESWNFPVKTCQLILFPSYLVHMVETKKGDNTRVSLAFNTFLRGTIGDENDLTELKL